VAAKPALQMFDGGRRYARFSCGATRNIGGGRDMLIFAAETVLEFVMAVIAIGLLSLVGKVGVI